MSAVNFNLKKVRIEKGVTQVDLSEKSGITQQQISRYETGLRIPNIEARILTRKLRIDFSFLWHTHGY